MQPAPAPIRAAESVAIGLQALHLLNRDGVAITPVSLEVWMLHASGALPHLSDDIALLSAHGGVFTETDIAGLFDRHCAKPDWHAETGQQSGPTANLREACACIDQVRQIAEEFRSTVDWAMKAMGPEADTATRQAVTEVLGAVVSRMIQEAARASISLTALRRRLELNR